MPNTQPKATPAVASALVLKTSRGELRGLNVVAGASAGYVMLLDAATVPAAGAVAPKRCWAIAANASLDLEFPFPLQFLNGITVLFSTTGPFAYAVSATAFIAGEAA